VVTVQTSNSAAPAQIQIETKQSGTLEDIVRTVLSGRFLMFPRPIDTAENETSKPLLSKKCSPITALLTSLRAVEKLANRKNSAGSTRVMITAPMKIAGMLAANVKLGCESERTNATDKATMLVK